MNTTICGHIKVLSSYDSVMCFSLPTVLFVQDLSTTTVFSYNTSDLYRILYLKTAPQQED